MATESIRVRGRDPLAELLGWFSFALGAAEVTAPRAICRLIGAQDESRGPLVVRAMGIRELAHGIGILMRPRPRTWLWSRVAGDALDLAALSVVAARNPGRRGRTAFAIASVLAVTAPDLRESLRHNRRSGPPHGAERIRKAVTIRAPKSEVESAWAHATELRDKIVTEGGTVYFEDAPGDRGTELRIEVDWNPPAGDLGAVVLKLTGNHLATQLSDDLRRFKQLVETGEIVRSDSTPDGHLVAEHLKQRAAQPLAGAMQ
jgi:hypothetical protein